MSKAYMTFPDGGRIYKDAAGRLLAYVNVGGKAGRKRVKTELDGERWLARTFLAATPDFLPGLAPEIREMNLRLKWRREAQLATETDPARRQELARELAFIRLQGHRERTPELFAELETPRPGARREAGGDAGRLLAPAQERDAAAALRLLRAGAPGRTLVEAVRAFLSAGGAAPGTAAARRLRRGPRSAAEAAPEAPAPCPVLTLRETARVLFAVYANAPEILEPAVYALFCQANPATALEMAARRRKGKPVSNSPVVDKWLKIVRRAEAAAGGPPAPLSPAGLAHRTAEALRLAGVAKPGADPLRHTGNAFLWRREVVRGNGEDAAMKMRLPRRECERRYSGIDIAPLDIEAFFELSPFELAGRFVAPALAKLRAAGGAPLPPADPDRPMGETLRRLAPPAGGDWSAAAGLARDLASFNPARTAAGRT